MSGVMLFEHSDYQRDSVATCGRVAQIIFGGYVTMPAACVCVCAHIGTFASRAVIGV